MPVVYLLHFDRPHPGFKRSIQHYIGWTIDLNKRVSKHRAGKGAALARVMKEAGIDFSVVRTWEVETKDEAWGLEIGLKAKKRARTLCPLCRGGEKVEVGRAT